MVMHTLRDLHHTLTLAASETKSMLKKTFIVFLLFLTGLTKGYSQEIEGYLIDESL